MSAIRDDDFNHREPGSDLQKEVEQLRRQVAELRHQVEADHQKEPNKSEKSENQPPKQEKREEPAKPPMSQRARTWVRQHPVGFIILLVVLAALILGGIVLWNYMESYESTDDAQIDGHMDAISSRVSGTVLGIHVEDNQTVAQDQVVVELDPTNYQIAVDQARSNLAQAESQLAAANPVVPITETSNQSATATSQADVESAEAQVSAAQREYDSAVADLHQAEAVSIRASSDEARYRGLIAKDEVSKELYDQKVADARASEAGVEARKASAEAAQRKIAESQAALASAKSRLAETRSNNPRRVLINRATIATRDASVKTAKAQLDQALLNLSYCKIVAPSAGVVGNKTVEIGEHIEAGQPLFMITQTNDVWVTADYKETQLERMQPGQPVTASVDALGLDFNGYVESMPGATGAKFSLLPPENATGNYVKVVQRLPVRIRLKPGQNGMDRLRPGMSVETSVKIR